MKQVRVAAGMLSAAMLVGIPGTLKAAATDLPVASTDPGVVYAVTKGDKVKVTADSLNVRKSADNKSDIVGLLHKGDVCTITDTKQDSRGVTWGKLDGNKGWINLDFTDAASTFQSYDVKVTAGSLNVRQSANSSSKVLSTLKKGDKVTIVAEQKDSRGITWGKLSNGKGWINLNFTTKSGEKAADTFTEYNVKVTAASLNIRKSADKSSAVQGILNKNDVVTIVAEQKDSRGVTWGKLSNGKGWISLLFATKTNDAAGSTFKAYSVQVTADTLNIRKSASNTGTVVGFLKKGNIFTIVAEQKDSRGVTWGKLGNGDGWINLNFTKKV